MPGFRKKSRRNRSRRRNSRRRQSRRNRTNGGRRYRQRAGATEEEKMPDDEKKKIMDELTDAHNIEIKTQQLIDRRKEIFDEKIKILTDNELKNIHKVKLEEFLKKFKEVVDKIKAAEGENALNETSDADKITELIGDLNIPFPDISADAGDGPSVSGSETPGASSVNVQVNEMTVKMTLNDKQYTATKEDDGSIKVEGPAAAAGV
jgi:hypothetical protein